MYRLHNVSSAEKREWIDLGPRNIFHKLACVASGNQVKRLKTLGQKISAHFKLNKNIKYYLREIAENQTYHPSASITNYYF